jgi:hypothetical protein
VSGGKERKKELWDAAAPVRKVQPEFAAAGKVRSGERSRQNVKVSRHSRGRSSSWRRRDADGL